jgi:hypothetical protein
LDRTIPLLVGIILNGPHWPHHTQSQCLEDIFGTNFLLMGGNSALKPTFMICGAYFLCYLAP